MLGVSSREGYTFVDDPADAEVIVVNTCGFIEAAKEESINTVLELSTHKTQSQCQTLVMAGCLSQRYADELAESMPEVDHFMGSSDMLKLSQILNHKAERMLVGNPADYTLRASDPRIVTQTRHSVYMKIAEGCNRQCSFCAIPGIRGKQRSRSIEDLAEEAKQLVDQGTVEINLISQDTIAYGRDLPSRPTLAELVARLAETPGLKWLRLHYLYPEQLSPALLELIAQHPVVVPYIDMPLQHASDAMLQRMRRGHRGARMYRVVEQLRKAIPKASLRTTFILGHPGESDADFQALYDFVEWAHFDHVGLFRYSREEGTHSAQWDDMPSKSVIYNRFRKLNALQRRISRNKLKHYKKQTIDVLVDGLSDESDLLLQGRHAGQAPEVDGNVYLSNALNQRPGDICKARVIKHTDYDLIAECLEEEQHSHHHQPLLARQTKSRTTLPVLA